MVLGQPLGCVVDVSPVGAKLGQEAVAWGLSPVFQNIESCRGVGDVPAPFVQNTQINAIAAGRFLWGGPGQLGGRASGRVNRLAQFRYFFGQIADCRQHGAFRLDQAPQVEVEANGFAGPIEGLIRINVYIHGPAYPFNPERAMPRIK